MALRKDAAEHRRLILRTAQDLFSTYGVDSVTMHQIAKAAAIGQGTLYRNYTNKADLCLDLMRECSWSLEKTIERIVEDSRMPVRDRLEQVLSHILEFIEEKSLWLGAVQTPACPEGRSGYYRSHVYTSAHGNISRLLADGVRRNECTADLDPVIGADTILAAVDPDLYLFLRKGRGYSREDIKGNLQSMYLEPLFRTKG